MGFFFLFFSSLFLFHRFLSGLEDEKPLFMHLGGRVRRIKIYTMLAFAMELPIMTLFTKFTMAVAGCSGSSSANTWHWLSDLCAGFLATNPKHRLERRNVTIVREYYFASLQVLNLKKKKNRPNNDFQTYKERATYWALTDRPVSSLAKSQVRSSVSKPQ